MSIIIKSVWLGLTVAICGAVIHHVTTDLAATDSVVMSATLPNLSRSESSRLFTRNSDETSGRIAVDHFQALKEHLQAARTAVEAMPGYTAILEMQEEVDDELRPVDRIKFKTRRHPFSVYMRWSDSEQEALYVDGENDNRLIVKPTKGLAAIRRVWRLDPDCRMAKQTCRYPITDVGIENMVIRVQTFYDEQQDLVTLADCKMEQSTLSGLNVVLFNVTFNDEATVPKYCASRFCFDTQSKLLVAVDNYGWSKDGKPRLIEHYFYDQIEACTDQDENEFTEDNPAYHFVAR